MKNLAILSVLVCVVAGCTSNQGYLGDQGQKAIKCAENWEGQGYNFDPNSMTCWQMFQKVTAIRRAEYWKEKGYNLDPNTMTSEEMDEQTKHIDRARYWKEHGYDFDPYVMTANEMDNKAAELNSINYWTQKGYYYDTNSQTVFLNSQKRTKLSSLAGLHKHKSGQQDFSSSYPRSSYPKNNSYKKYSQPIPPPPSIPSTSHSSVIESKINGDFEGWEGETIVKLINGQIWQQTEYYYHYHYAFMPNVLIFQSEGAWKMKVEGIDKPVRVQQLDSDRNTPQERLSATIPRAYAGVGGGHWLENNIDSGTYMVLEDGTLWEIDPFDKIDAMLWLPVSNITVIESSSGSPGYDYLIINTDDGEKAHAKYIGQQ